MSLQHEQPSEESIPTAQIRVKPEELRRALEAIERRREEMRRLQEEEEHRLAETVPIGEAVDSLDLDTTPEEVWAEVQAQRNSTEKELSPTDSQPEKTIRSDFRVISPSSYTPPSLSHPLGKGIAGSVIGGSVLMLALGFLIWHGTATPTPNARFNGFSGSNAAPFYNPQNTMKQLTSTLDADFYRKLALSRGAGATYRPTLVALSIWPEIRPEETAYPERAIPDGYGVYENPYSRNPNMGPLSGIVFRAASDTTIQPQMPGTSASSQAMPSAPVIQTTRYEGRSYLRCWIAKSDIPALRQAHAVVLYTSRSVGDVSSENLVPLTTPLHELFLIPKPVGKPLVEPNPFIPVVPYNGSSVRTAEATLRGCYVKLPAGYHLPLDRHAWENYPNLVPPRFTPPAWMSLPAVLDNFDTSPQHNQYSEFDASSDVVKIGQIPNERAFHCGQPIMERILTFLYIPLSVPIPRIPIADVLVDQRPNLWRPYTLIKHNGHLYFRGWVASRLSEARLPGHKITIYGDGTAPELGETPTQITLRLDQCHLQANMGAPMLIASDVHLDSHAYEKW